MTEGLDSPESNVVGIADALENPDELLLRQVHPDQIKVDGDPSSSAFRPSRSDLGLLSTRREHIGAERAYREWSKDHLSAGTWGMSVEEIETVKLRAFDDSHEPGQPEGHASVDFQSQTNARQNKTGRILRDLSVERGCLHAHC